MLDWKEHWFCLEAAGHTIVKIHVLLIRTDSNVAEWEGDPSESTQPYLSLCRWNKGCCELLSCPGLRTPRANHAKTLKLMCTAGSRDLQDLFTQRGTSFWPPTCLSQRADCPGSLLKSIIEMKGSSSGSEKWWMKSLSFILAWNSRWLERTFVLLIYFKKRNRFQHVQCFSSSNI